MNSELLNELKGIRSDLKKQHILTKPILTIEEAAEYLDLSISYLYKLTSSRQIPHYAPTGKRIYFDRNEINQWVLSRKLCCEDTETIASTYLNTKNSK